MFYFLIKQIFPFLCYLILQGYFVHLKKKKRRTDFRVADCLPCFLSTSLTAALGISVQGLGLGVSAQSLPVSGEKETLEDLPCFSSSLPTQSCPSYHLAAGGIRMWVVRRRMRFEERWRMVFWGGAYCGKTDLMLFLWT